MNRKLGRVQGMYEKNEGREEKGMFSATAYIYRYVQLLTAGNTCGL